MQRQEWDRTPRVAKGRSTKRGSTLVSHHRHQVRVNLYVTYTPAGGTAHTVPRLGVVVAR